MSAKIRYIAMQHLNCCLARNGLNIITIEISFLFIILHKKATNRSANGIVIVKRKYIFEVETLPQHEICPPMRYFN